MAGIMISIGASASGLKKELKSASRSLEKFRKDANKGAANIAKIGAASITAGAGITAGLVKKGLDAVDAQAKLSKQLRTTTSSIATLERAGELAGVKMSQIAAGARTLDKQMGDASRGVAVAAENFERLGINADELARMSLDERILAVNQAIAENIPLTEQAAVAAELFGNKNAAAIRQIDPETMAEAARQAAIFGQNLSDIDAAKVENANDAISTISNGMDGLTKQLAIKFAPAIEAIGKGFLGAAEDADGMGSIADGVFNGIITSIGFVVDAIHGVKVVFQTVADGLIMGFAGITSSFAEIISKFLSGLDSLPFTDFSQEIQATKDFANAQGLIITEARQAIIDRLNEPLPSEGLKNLLAEAQAASDEAAVVAASKRQENKNVEIQEEEIHAEKKIEIAKKTSEQLAKQAEKDEKNRQKLAKASSAANINGLRQGIGALQALQDTGNKKQFENNKKLAKADAAISMYQGIAAGVKLGWPLAIPAVAYAAATGMQQISQINSQSYGGGASASAASAPAAAAPAADSSGGGESSNSNLFVKGINPDDMFSGQQLVDIINTAQDEGAVLRTA